MTYKPQHVLEIQHISQSPTTGPKTILHSCTLQFEKHFLTQVLCPRLSKCRRCLQCVTVGWREVEVKRRIHVNRYCELCSNCAWERCKRQLQSDVHEHPPWHKKYQGKKCGAAFVPSLSKDHQRYSARLGCQRTQHMLLPSMWKAILDSIINHTTDIYYILDGGH